MSFYQKLAAVGTQFISKHKLFKHGFNLSPMYRRSTGRIIEVSKDLMYIKVKLPISYKNRNYVNSIFGGSMFSAVDPIPMVQLMNILDKGFVVWDKSAQINFKRPAKEDLYAEFSFTKEEVKRIKADVAEKNEIELVKTSFLTDKEGSKIFCEVHKTIYVADKGFYKMKRTRKKEQGI
ncbi:DUF4442 domain-containing protein [Croceitalea sp. MTPC5]|uniref:DUF4442 domain-containing protein n=1 Tax=Croceitalea sp. MTPC5 TaxID=3056565 RepID=UPI002B3CB498|nr:DUF4442 domain-containing protein [Croceitalea sp. MTPC5]